MLLRMRIMRGASLLLEALAPMRCAACSTVAAAALCDACERTACDLPPPAPRQAGRGLACAAFEFSGPVREALHRGKYGGDRAALRRLAALGLPRLLPQLSGTPHAAIAVPLAARRQSRRGYNQAELIARELARPAGVAVLPGLRRVRETGVQANRDEPERRRNVAGAFAWHGAALDGTRLWLVDDVLTTGATAGAAAAALRAAGAARVDIVVLAAVP
jgi:competence protein ComFC